MAKKTHPNDGTSADEEKKDSSQVIFNPTDERDFKKAEAESYAAEYEKEAGAAQEEMKASEARRKEDLRKIRTVEKVDTEKIYNFKHEVGIFKRRGGTVKFTEDQFDKRSEKKFRKEASAIKEEKRDQFLKTFKLFHEHKDGDRGVVNREEIIHFAAGLKSGKSGNQFEKFADKLQKEGVIKSKEEIKKMFTPREIRILRNSLTGQTEGNLPKLDRGRVSDDRANRNTTRQGNRSSHVKRTFNRLSK